MIYTLTANPALDYTVTLPRLAPGGLHRAREARLACGGKGINVSRVLRSLGVESVALGFLAGSAGRLIRDLAAEEGLTAEFLLLERGMSRVNVKVRAGEETEINGPGPAVGPEDTARLLARLDRLGPGDTLVMAGSLPPGAPAGLYGLILARLAGRGVRGVVDAAGEPLAAALSGRPFLIKPNHRELGELWGRVLDPEDEAGLAEAARTLRDRGARNVLVSRGAWGALLLTEAGEILRRPAVRGRAAGTVGCGDAMLAGVLAGYGESGDWDRALDLGTAAGGAAAFTPGPPGRADIEAVLERL